MFFLHGMLASRQHWALNLPALGGFVQPVCIELWGHGDSPAPADDSLYQMQAIQAQLESVRQSLGLNQILLCGHSFSAGIVLRYAIKFPDRVRGVIFLNSLSALAPQTLFTQNPLREERIAAVAEMGAAAFKRMTFHPRNARRLPEAVREVLVREADRVNPTGFVKLNQITGPQLTVLDDLAQLRSPCLLVNGRFEKRFQPMREIAASQIPDCTVVDLDAGHAVNIEQPDSFNQAVIEFVSRLTN